MNHQLSQKDLRKRISMLQCKMYRFRLGARKNVWELIPRDTGLVHSAEYSSASADDVRCRIRMRVNPCSMVHSNISVPRSRWSTLTYEHMNDDPGRPSALQALQARVNAS